MAEDSRGERLLSDLNNSFRRDPEIDEYDFLPVREPKNNRSPLILQEHKLGLELWSVKILFQYAYNKLVSWRQNDLATKFLCPSDIIGLSRAVVLVNPDSATAWNIRKELVENGDLSVTDDLRLGALVLTKHPKSPETFSHRKWLLHKFVDSCLASSVGSNTSNGSNNAYDDFVNMDAIDLSLEAGANNSVIENGHVFGMQADFQEQMRREIIVCRSAAEKYPCNYNAWSHRIWVMQHCFNYSVQVLFGELHSTEGWIQKHISDHSGFHYRQFLLTSIQQQADNLAEQFSLNYKNLIQKEMHMVIDLIKSYPSHEAMWYHRRYVFQALCQSCDSNPVTKETLLSCDSELDAPITNTQKKTKFENEQQVLLLREVDLVSKCDLNMKDKFHKSLAQKYLDWVQKYCRG